MHNIMIILSINLKIQSTVYDFSSESINDERANGMGGANIYHADTCVCVCVCL